MVARPCADQLTSDLFESAPTHGDGPSASPPLELANTDAKVPPKEPSYREGRTNQRPIERRPLPQVGLTLLAPRTASVDRASSPRALQAATRASASRGHDHRAAQSRPARPRGRTRHRAGLHAPVRGKVGGKRTSCAARQSAANARLTARSETHWSRQVVVTPGVRSGRSQAAYHSTTRWSSPPSYPGNSCSASGGRQCGCHWAWAVGLWAGVTVAFTLVLDVSRGEGCVRPWSA